MGKLTTTGDDLADDVVSGNLTSAARSSSIAFGPGKGGNVAIWGTFTGSLSLERSFDGGATWVPVTDAYGVALVYTGPASVRVDEPERGVLYSLNATALSSGTANYRMSH